jgi:hypothetical protein
VRYAIGDASLRYGRDGIATSDNHYRAAVSGFGDGSSNRDCPLVEGRFFKDTHRTIPDYRPGVTKSI